MSKDITKMSLNELESFKSNLESELSTKITKMVQDPRIKEIYSELDKIEQEEIRRRPKNSG